MNKFWSTKQISDVKAEVKRLVDGSEAPPDGKLRLQRALQIVSETEDADSSDLQLKRFIAIISALVQHERYDGLQPATISKLCTMAHTILRVNHIDPEHSKLAFLYAEIHLLRGQIFRKNGDHWKAAWEQHMAIRYVDSTNTDDYKYQLLAAGNRLLRLAAIDDALATYAKVEGLGDGHVWAQARVGRIIACRLSGDLSLAARLSEEALQLSTFPPPQRSEVEWEGLCRAVQQDENLTKMLDSVRKHQSHHTDGYIIESTLWAAATHSRQWLDQTYSLAGLKFKRSQHPHGLCIMYDVARAVQDMYDTQVPLAVRIQSLGLAIEEVSSLTMIDREMLCWLAAARALIRSRGYELAKLCLHQYRRLSLELTQSRSPDALGLARDLYSRSWALECA